MIFFMSFALDAEINVLYSSFMRFVCGIDPGKHGAIALLSVDSNQLQFIKIPLLGTEINTGALCAALQAVAPQIISCTMEDVHSIFGASAKSNFQFGRVNGILECALTAAGIPFDKVQPKAWQSVAWKPISQVKTPTGKVNKRNGEPMFKVDTKATSLRAANQLFPDEKFLATARSTVPHDGFVDAALIAYFARLRLPVS